MFQQKILAFQNEKNTKQVKIPFKIATTQDEIPRYKFSKTCIIPVCGKA
jgi:hypothetical protein